VNITAFAINFRQFTFTVLLCLMVAGYEAYLALPRAQDPGFIMRRAQILIPFPGASPSRVELLVTDKIEKALQVMPEVDYIDSESRTGLSVINVNIKETYTDVRPIWDDMRRKVDKVKTELPNGVLTPIINDDFGDVFDIVIGITGDRLNYAELKSVTDAVRNEFLSLDQVAKVDIYGAQEDRIFVEYNNTRLSELKISPLQLIDVLGAHNIVNSGGEVNTGTEIITLEPTGSFRSLEELGQTLINIPGTKTVIALQDLAHIYRAFKDPPSTITHCTGKNCIALAISLRKGGNIIEMGRQVREVLATLKKQYPVGVEFHELIFQSDVVNFIIENFVSNLLQAICYAVGVTLIFLGLRTGIVASVLVPMSILASLLVMRIMNIGLDQVSLAALIIALGMLVDNSVVMCENMIGEMENGKTPIEAAIDSANELKIPLLTSTLCTSAAFLPIYLAESVTGEYTASIFKVVTITLLCAWVLALTVIPLLGVIFIRVKKIDSEGKNASQGRTQTVTSGFYLKFLLTILRHKWLTISVVCGLFYLSLVGFQYIPTVFFPPKEDAAFVMELEMPEATPIERTQDVVTHIEQYMREHLMVNDKKKQGIRSWVSFIGEGGPLFALNILPKAPNSKYSFFYINTSDNIVIDGLIADLNRYTFENFPDLTASVKRMDNGVPIENPIAIRVSGKDLNQIYTLVAKVKDKLSKIPGTVNISDNWGQQTKKLVVSINDAKTKNAGLTHLDIATSLQTAFSGIQLTQFRDQENIIPVILRSVNANRTDINKQENINVYSQNGTSVPAEQVVNLELVWQPGKIMHRDNQQTITVVANLAAGYNANEINQALMKWLKEQNNNWPVGYHWQLGGEWESSIKANAAIGDKVPIMALIIIILMMAEFNCMRRAFIVLITIPLAIMGVSAGLLLTGSYMGFMTLLGIISLAGIIVNNAIILLERIDIEVHQYQRTIQKAIMTACQNRLRPIMLTTGGNIVSLFPLWFGGGAMWEPMAIVLIFGLFFGTLLTLGVVPVLFSILFKVSFKNIRV
jgi:multidrug efflux pump subunit AcrB